MRNYYIMSHEFSQNFWKIIPQYFGKTPLIAKFSSVFTTYSLPLFLKTFSAPFFLFQNFPTFFQNFIKFLCNFATIFFRFFKIFLELTRSYPVISPKVQQKSLKSS